MRDALAAQETEERKLSIKKIQGNEVVVFFFSRRPLLLEIKAAPVRNYVGFYFRGRTVYSELRRCR